MWLKKVARLVFVVNYLGMLLVLGFLFLDCRLYNNYLNRTRYIYMHTLCIAM